MFWTANFFWIFVLVIVLAAMVSTMIRSYQREKTIRIAIEKGVTLDPAMLRARTSSPEDARAGLLTGAITTLFVGLGLAAMGYVLSLNGNAEAFWGLAAVGALLWCISLGLFLARLAVSRGS
ncbi:MAG TPA: DUF6249 domain-containing protein [Rhizomicrobium sp.]